MTCGSDAVVVDSSILLAVFFAEPHGAWAAARLREYAGALRMSTVNLAEVLIRLRDRQPTLYPQMEARVLGSGIRFVAPTVEQARVAADARVRLPLNLGDCFAYALAVAEDCPILTLDEDFRRAGHSVVMP
jgi:ribonuclease VapC